jgi:hypothetical protein
MTRCWAGGFPKGRGLGCYSCWRQGPRSCGASSIPHRRPCARSPTRTLPGAWCMYVPTRACGREGGRAAARSGGVYCSTIEVHRCHTGRSGSYHCKALVIDRSVLYTGSANFTGKSRRNSESVFRMTGPVVEQVRRQLAADRSRWVEWDGKS